MGHHILQGDRILPKDILFKEANVCGDLLATVNHQLVFVRQVLKPPIECMDLFGVTKLSKVPCTHQNIALWYTFWKLGPTIGKGNNPHFGFGAGESSSIK